jgi:hypothetical protein
MNICFASGQGKLQILIISVVVLILLTAIGAPLGGLLVDTIGWRW